MYLFTFDIKVFISKGLLFWKLNASLVAYKLSTKKYSAVIVI